jgi:hypothetical protein
MVSAYYMETNILKQQRDIHHAHDSSVTTWRLSLCSVHSTCLYPHVQWHLWIGRCSIYRSKVGIGYDYVAVYHFFLHSSPAPFIYLSY